MDAVSCLAPPAALLSSSGFTDAAIARALHYSMSGSSAASSSSSAPSPLLADFACGTGGFASAPPMITCESVLVADSARPSPGPGRAQQRLAPAGGRAGNRRSRASKRAPTTYISTDPANFRLMVQQITGVQAEPVSLDASVLLAAADTSPAGAFGNPLPPAVPFDDAALHHQQPCFPTLDSWSVMYESSELL